ncbi:MAG: hypothetical protein QM677_00470 [Microbacterium sp.]
MAGGRTPSPTTGAAFPLAHAIAADASATTIASAIAWGADVPALPAAIQETARNTWGLEIVTDASASLPAHPALAAAYAHARAEQVVRALSARTNLVLPGARVVVVGAGPVGSAIAAVLGHLGSRVTVATDDDTAAVRLQLSGARVVRPREVEAADLLIATGEGHAPLDATELTGVLADAATTPGALVVPAGALPEARAHVRTLGDRTWIVDLPRPIGKEGAESGEGAEAATALEAHIADLVVAASLARARCADRANLGDTRLAAELRA